jgi:hypothetical protein
MSWDKRVLRGSQLVQQLTELELQLGQLASEIPMDRLRDFAKAVGYRTTPLFELIKVASGAKVRHRKEVVEIARAKLSKRMKRAA